MSSQRVLREERAETARIPVFRLAREAFWSLAGLLRRKKPSEAGHNEREADSGQPGTRRRDSAVGEGRE